MGDCDYWNDDRVASEVELLSVGHPTCDSLPRDHDRTSLARLATLLRACSFSKYARLIYIIAFRSSKLYFFHGNVSYDQQQLTARIAHLMRPSWTAAARARARYASHELGGQCGARAHQL